MRATYQKISGYRVYIIQFNKDLGSIEASPNNLSCNTNHTDAISCIVL